MSKASDIQKKLKGLYKDIGPEHFQVSDTKLLRYEKLGFENKERWRNATEEEKAKWRFKTEEQKANWRKEVVDNPEWKEKVTKENIARSKTKKWQETMSGVPKTLEGNKKLSKATKGKKKDPKVVAKVSKTMTGRTHSRTRGINTSVKNFDKVVDAARYFDVSEMSIKNWCNNKGITMTDKKVIKKLTDKGIKFNENNYPIGFEWAEGRENLGAKKVQTPDGIFNSCIEASKHYKISANALRSRCHNDKWPDFCFLDEKSEFKSKQ